MTKKILQVCNTDFYANQFLAPLFIALRKKGYQIDLVCEGKRLSNEVKSSVSNHYNIAFPKKASLFSFFSVMSKCKKIITNNNYILCNSHNRNASIPIRLSFLLSFDRRLKKTINCYTAHGFYFHDGQSLFGYYLTVLLEYVLSFADDLILSQSYEDATFFSKLPGCRKKIHGIGNGIKIEKFYKLSGRNRESRERELNLNLGSIRIVFVGRIVKNKGIEDLLEAFSLIKHNNIELVLVGGVIEQETNSVLPFIYKNYRNLIDKSNLVITGMVSNVEDYLSVSDIFVSPSYREGMPRSTIEGQASSLGVIATNIRGNREIVEKTVNGLTYEPGNITELKEAIEFLISNSKKLDIFSKRARENARNNFSEINYIERQLKLIEEKIYEKC